MAISWTDDRSGAKRTSHEGLVVGPTFRAVERVMSDVYSDVTRVWVWDPAECKPATVVLTYGFELNSETGFAVPDATPEVAAAYAEYNRVQEEQIAEARRVYEAAQAVVRAKELLAVAHANSIVNGSMVRVISGPKADRGTVGKVFWKRDGRLGVQVGDEKLPNGYAKNVCWTNVKNVELCA